MIAIYMQIYAECRMYNKMTAQNEFSDKDIHHSFVNCYYNKFLKIPIVRIEKDLQ